MFFREKGRVKMDELFKAIAEFFKLIRISGNDAARARRTLLMIAMTSFFIITVITGVALVARFIWPQ
jgi:hypothetical protein